MESRSNDDEVNLDQTDFSNSKISTDTTTTNDYADESLNDTKEEEEVIPLMAEELDVIKTELVDEATITKEPVKETNTEQIPIMHEELVIEQRPVNENSSQSLPSDNNEEFKPVETNTQLKIPIKREEVEVTKKPYVVEELVIKKKTVTETQTVSEEIITETVNDPQV
jgi:uncharacterized protein (TIGR02271 family)